MNATATDDKGNTAARLARVNGHEVVEAMLRVYMRALDKTEETSQRPKKLTLRERRRMTAKKMSLQSYP